MKTIWKIYDNYHEKMLDAQYNTEDEAEKCLKTIIAEKETREESYDFDVVEAEYVIKHDDIYNLQCDLDRLEYYQNKGNLEKVQDYLNMLVSHVKDMMKDE